MEKTKVNKNTTTQCSVTLDNVTSNFFINNTGVSTATSYYDGLPSTSITTTGGSYYQYSSPNAFYYNDFWKCNEFSEILWRSYLDGSSVFKNISDKNVNHPCSLIEDEKGLIIEIAVVGIDKKDINILVDSETLRVSYKKEEKEEEKYIHNTIKKSSFDIAWKLSTKYNLSEMEANVDKGLLILNIPFSKENKPKRIEIK